MEAQTIHLECESDVAAALPAVNAAIAALESLNKTDIIGKLCVCVTAVASA